MLTRDGAGTAILSRQNRSEARCNTSAGKMPTARSRSFSLLWSCKGLEITRYSLHVTTFCLTPISYCSTQCFTCFPPGSSYLSMWYWCKEAVDPDEAVGDDKEGGAHGARGGSRPRPRARHGAPRHRGQQHAVGRHRHQERALQPRKKRRHHWNNGAADQTGESLQDWP